MPYGGNAQGKIFGSYNNSSEVDQLRARTCVWTPCVYASTGLGPAFDYASFAFNQDASTIVGGGAASVGAGATTNVVSNTGRFVLTGAPGSGLFGLPAGQWSVEAHVEVENTTGGTVTYTLDGQYNSVSVLGGDEQNVAIPAAESRVIHLSFHVGVTTAEVVALTNNMRLRLTPSAGGYTIRHRSLMVTRIGPPLS